MYFAYLNREELHERFQARKLLSMVRSKYGKYVKLDYLTIDERSKYFKCVYKAKYSALANGVNEVNEIRKGIEQFLVGHEDYFLNDNYEIIILFRTIADEHIVFSNKNPYNSTRLIPSQLRYIDINVSCNISDLRQYNDAQSLRSDIARYDDLGVLQNFNSLKYLSNNVGFKPEEEKKILDMLPDCKIVRWGVAEANWFK